MPSSTITAAGSRGCKGLADTVRYSAYGILLLIAVATAAAVSFATRAGLDAHHEMVALLHQMGALAGFIARAVEWHYFVSALGAAAVGTRARGAVLPGRGRAGDSPASKRCPSCRRLSLQTGSEIAWLLAVPAVAGADRLGDGAHLGAVGGAGHLLVTVAAASCLHCRHACLVLNGLEFRLKRLLSSR